MPKPDASFASRDEFMPQNPTDVLVLGNAIVDIIARTDDDFLRAQDLRKGGMQLIDEARAEDLYAVMGLATVVSGGSGANTAVGVAALGGRAGFIGQVRDDELRRPFSPYLRGLGGGFKRSPSAHG